MSTRKGNMSNRLRIGALGSLLMLLSPLALAAGPSAVRRQIESSMLVTGTVEITAEGTVRASTLDKTAKLPAELGDWVQAQLPKSGGVVEWTRNGPEFDVRAGDPDKRVLIGEARIAELEGLQERSSYLSLFDLLQTIMAVHENGAELPTIWAEVNVVRRTTKRLLCSIVSGYNCFHYKQRRPGQLLWRFDEARLEQGFKRNKRKFMRNK